MYKGSRQPIGKNNKNSLNIETIFYPASYYKDVSDRKIIIDKQTDIRANYSILITKHSRYWHVYGRKGANLTLNKFKSYKKYTEAWEDYSVRLAEYWNKRNKL